MNIRPLVKEDIIKVLPAIKSFCSEIEQQFDMLSAIEFIAESISKGWMMDVVEEDGKFIGMGGVALQPYYVNGKMNGVEFVWHSDPTLPQYKRAKVMLALLERMESFTKEHGVPLVLSVNRSNGLGKFIEKRGYELSKESVYRRD